MTVKEMDDLAPPSHKNEGKVSRLQELQAKTEISVAGLVLAGNHFEVFPHKTLS